MSKFGKLLSVIVFVIVFLLGYSFPKFIFATSKDGLVATLRNMPQRGVISNVTGKGLLNPSPVYDKIMKSILSDYYKDTDETKITYSGIHGMLLAFEDPFSNFFEPDEYKEMKEENEGNFSGIGAVLQMTEKGQVLVNEVTPKAPAEKAGIKAGDIIVAVDGNPTAGRNLSDVVKDIRGEEGTVVKITLERKGSKEHISFNVTRGIVPIINSTHKMFDEKNKIGYVTLKGFTQTADDDIDIALSDLESKGMKGLILDLRNNPGGLLDMAVNISSRFVDKGIVVIIQSRGGYRQNIMVDSEKHNHNMYPLVILVNGSSASASEIVSGCIKDHEAGTIVGDTTFGKGLVQSQVPLNDGSAISITTAKYFTPSGTDIHKKGIEPDYFVKQNENYDSKIDESDYQLQAARKILLVKMGVLKAEELSSIEAKSKELKKEHQEKQAEKEKKEAKKNK